MTVFPAGLLHVIVNCDTKTQSNKPAGGPAKATDEVIVSSSTTTISTREIFLIIRISPL
jgi:hypothetical protein